MKKVLFVLALVAAYGVSMATSNTVDIQETQVVLIADLNSNDVVTPEGDKEGEKTAVAAKTPAKAEGCATAKTAAKAEGCSTAKTAAKAEGCSGTKTAAKAKSGCGSSCGGTAKK
jgi:hypothetical protein